MKSAAYLGAAGAVRREFPLVDAKFAAGRLSAPVRHPLHGCAVQRGRHMLNHQVEAIWSFFGLP